MPQCQKCRKKGLFLKIKKDTCLCFSCYEEFIQEGKILTEKIAEAKNKATIAMDPKEVVKLCKVVEHFGNELVAFHQANNLEPSQELLDLIETHKKIRELAEQ